MGLKEAFTGKSWVNEGPDKRFCGPVGAFFQRLFSFRKETPPAWHVVSHDTFTYQPGWDLGEDYLPETRFAGGRQQFVSYGMYWSPRPYYIKQTLIREGADIGRIKLFRVGWRYDRASKEFIWGAANKITDHPMRYGY